MEVKPLSASSSMKKQRLAKISPDRNTSITSSPSSLVHNNNNIVGEAGEDEP